MKTYLPMSFWPTPMLLYFNPWPFNNTCYYWNRWLYHAETQPRPTPTLSGVATLKRNKGRHTDQLLYSATSASFNRYSRTDQLLYICIQCFLPMYKWSCVVSEIIIATYIAFLYIFIPQWCTDTIISAVSSSVHYSNANFYSFPNGAWTLKLLNYSNAY